MKDLGNILSGGSSSATGPVQTESIPEESRKSRIAGILSNTASGVSGLFSIREGFEKSRLLERRATSFDAQARQELNRGKADQITATNDLNRSLANVLVATGASGLNVSGSPGVTASQIVKTGDQTLGFIRRGAEARAANFRSSAKEARSGKKLAKISGFVKAFSTFAGAFSRSAKRG